MYSCSNQVSQNLSLRLSPNRKYPPIKTTICPPKCPQYVCHCCDCCCYSCCHCCCCDPCCLHLHFDYSSSSPELKKPSEEEKNLKKSENNMENQINEVPKEEEEPKEKINEYNNINYEQNQFNDFLGKLMEIESKIEDAKISLAINPDFNCEDAFRLFESNDKGFLDINDIKEGLNLLCIFPTQKELNLLMKRFDLQKNGFLNFAYFFDMVVPFEKSYRQRVECRPPRSCCPCRSPEVFSSKTVYYLKNLFNLIINFENEINNYRRTLGTLRLKLNDIFALLDKDGKGFFDNKEMMEYFDNNGLLKNIRDADLLFIRLDKNRNGKIDFPEVEDELQTLY